MYSEWRFRLCGAVTAGLVLSALGAEVQGLADAASRAAKERNASAATSVTRITDKDLPPADRLEAALRDFLLTKDGFWKYVQARRDILDVRTKQTAIDEELLNAERDANDPFTIEAIIVGNRTLLAQLDDYTITPRIYILTEVAFRRARTDAALSDDEISRLPPTRAANAAYVRKNDDDIRGTLSYQWGEKEKWLERRRATRHVP
jgi:hypothetical protein